MVAHGGFKGRDTTPYDLFFFLNDPATPEFHPLPLHDALPISSSRPPLSSGCSQDGQHRRMPNAATSTGPRDKCDSIGSRRARAARGPCEWETALCTLGTTLDRKSTRLNSSHSQISYAVFCLKK